MATNRISVNRTELSPAYLCRFAHFLGQLLGGLGQQRRGHVAFGHVGVHHKHRHLDCWLQVVDVSFARCREDEDQLTHTHTHTHGRKSRLNLLLIVWSVCKHASEMATTPLFGLEDPGGNAC